MTRQPSIAHHYSVSFNPRTSQAEKAADQIMQDLLAKGFKQKDILLDAVLRAGGVDPALFNQDGLTPARVESILAQFADHILGEIRNMGGVVPAPLSSEPEPPGRSSPFARNLARSYAARTVENGDDD